MLCLLALAVSMAEFRPFDKDEVMINEQCGATEMSLSASGGIVSIERTRA